MIGNRTNRQKRATIIRDERVLVLKAVRKEYPQSTKRFHLFKHFVSKMVIDEGMTKAEIAKALYSQVFSINYDRAIVLATLLIRQFNRWKKNKAAVLKGVYDKQLGVWVYYNMKKPIEHKPLEQAKKKIIQGMFDADQRDLEILRMNPRRRKRLAEILIEEEDLRYGY